MSIPVWLLPFYHFLVMVFDMTGLTLRDAEAAALGIVIGIAWSLSIALAVRSR